MHTCSRKPRLRGCALVVALLAVALLGVARAAEPGAKAGKGGQGAVPPLIMLLTDFGSKGYLLGSLKGAIYKHFPGARIDSISNDIRKFDVDEAAQTLVLSTADYPPGTIFVVVVDPGMGRPRTPIVLETENGQIYLAPDNGVLTQVAVRYRVKQVRRITNREIIATDPAESTFMSRDVYGPAAAALAKGEVTVAQLGPEHPTLYLLSAPPAVVRDNHVYGTVRLVDGYGNIQTNIQAAQLEKLGLSLGDDLEVAVAGKRFRVKWVKAYGDVEQGACLARLGSHDEIQLAINQGNLAAEMHVDKGDVVVLGKP